jgi:hypothetical protein
MYGEYSEVVEESGDYRAKIIVDSDAQKPDWDGQAFVLQTDSSHYASIKAEAFTDHAEPFVDAFNRLSDLYYGNGYQYEVFERYLRIFHGATKVDSYNVGVTREYGYVAFDTAAWREEMGVSDSFKDEDILHDVRAWAEGDVWGVGLEKRVRWSTDDEDYEDMDTWVEDEDGFVWGYYGHDYAEQEAKDLLKAKLAE